MAHSRVRCYGKYNIAKPFRSAARRDVEEDPMRSKIQVVVGIKLNVAPSLSALYAILSLCF